MYEILFTKAPDAEYGRVPGAPEADGGGESDAARDAVGGLGGQTARHQRRTAEAASRPTGTAVARPTTQRRRLHSQGQN